MEADVGSGPTTCTLTSCLAHADCLDGRAVGSVCLETGDAFRSKSKGCYRADAVQKTCAGVPGTTALLYESMGDSADREAACVPNGCTTAARKPNAFQDHGGL